MFNEPLYNALVAAFGDVVVTGKGMALTLKRKPTLQGLFGQKLKDFKIDNDLIEDGGEYYVVNCPFCGDTRKRLWVCHALGGTYEVDGKHIPITKNLAVCYNEQCLKDTDNWWKFQGYLKGIGKPTLIPQTGTGVSSGALPPVDFPDPTFMVNAQGADPTITSYLTGRGYDLDELANDWNFRYGYIDIYNVPVVIMPVFYRGKCPFWQARYPVNGDIPEFFKNGRRKPKYYLPAGSKKSFVLYNLERAIHTDYVVLTEGIFDVVRVGASGVCMFGKDLSSRQLQDLQVAAFDKTLVWIPDMDDPQALEIAKKRVNAFNKRGLFQGGAKLLELSDGDPADYTREELWALISQLPATR